MPFNMKLAFKKGLLNMKANLVHFLALFCLFLAFSLLLVTSISAPTVHRIGMMVVTSTGTIDRLDAKIADTTGHGNLTIHGMIDQYDSTAFIGAFGYCVMTGGSKWDITTCLPPLSHFHLPGNDGIQDLLGCNSENSAACKMVNLMVFHPIACFLTAIALLFNALLFKWRGICICKPQVGVIFAVLAWMMTVVAMVADFIVFGATVERLNKHGRYHAKFSIGMWTCLAATFSLLAGVLILLWASIKGQKSQPEEAAADCIPATPLVSAPAISDQEQGLDAESSNDSREFWTPRSSNPNDNPRLILTV